MQQIDFVLRGLDSKNIFLSLFFSDINGKNVILCKCVKYIKKTQNICPYMSIHVEKCKCICVCVYTVYRHIYIMCIYIHTSTHTYVFIYLFILIEMSKLKGQRMTSPCVQT